MPDRRFLDKFLALASTKYPESFFLDELPLPAHTGDDYHGHRDLLCDLIEIDGRGRLHLWQFVPVRAPELVTGDAIGRLFACTQVLGMTEPAALAARLARAAKRRRYDTRSARFRTAVRRARPSFDSWNLVACGGQGCELAGQGNLLFRLYASLSSAVGHVRDVNTWHFYQTATGFDLRCLWDLAACGRLSMADKLAVYGGQSRLVAMVPGDDFDISSKRDLHLKRKKGFHAQGAEAYFADRSQILAR